jgi:hypothetical protein
MPGCFLAGTLVATKSGLKAIEEIESGELVLARDDETTDLAWQPVRATMRRVNLPVLKLEVVAEDGTIDRLGVTGEHPFWVEDRGWVPAADLSLGDELFSPRGGWLKVGAGTWLTTRHDVYNLEVGRYSTYFVGETKVWVHNNGGCPGNGGGEGGGTRIDELRPLEGPAHRRPRPELQRLTDDELLNAARNPADGSPLLRNTKNGQLMDGNGRAYELQRRAADPNSSISPDDVVPVRDYTPNNSMFWDLE